MKKSKPPMVGGGTSEEKKTPKNPPPLGSEDTEVPSVRPLDFEQRTRLRTLLADPVFRQAWNNAMACRPAVTPAGLDTPQGLQIGNNRLHQLQGWELFRAALLREQHERKASPQRITENYPDAGTIEAEAKRQLEQKKPTL